MVAHLRFLSPIERHSRVMMRVAATVLLCMCPVPSARAANTDGAVLLLTAALECPVEPFVLTSVTARAKGEQWMGSTIKRYSGTSELLRVILDSYYVDKSGVAEFDYAETHARYTVTYADLDSPIITGKKITLRCSGNKQCIWFDSLNLSAKLCWRLVVCGDVAPDSVEKTSAESRLNALAVIEFCDSDSANDAFVALKYLIDVSK